MGITWQIKSYINELLGVCFVYQQRQDQLLHMLQEMLLVSCFYPTQTHWIAVERKMRYLNETPDFGLLYLANDSIIGFSDADWDGDHDDRKSTSGFAFMMSGTAISWNNKKQICVTLSTEKQNTSYWQKNIRNRYSDF